METDPFSDSIRRKLESIRPDFSEKDWQRMQATLRQATPLPTGSPTGHHPFRVSPGSARPWMLAAASVSFVVLVSFAAWQRAQITSLRQTVSQLRQQPTARPRQTPTEPAAPSAVLQPDQPTAQQGEAPSNPLNQSADRSRATTDRPDTVYVTRYVAVPSQPGVPAPGRTAQRSVEGAGASSADRADRVGSLASAQPQQRKTIQPSASDQRTDAAEQALPGAEGTTNAADNTSPVVGGAVRNRTNGTTNNGADNRPGSAKPTTRQSDERIARQDRTPPNNTLTDRRKRRSVPALTDDRTTSDGLPTVDSGKPTAIVPAERATNQPAANYALTTSRPVTMKVTNWNEALARQFKRMPPAWTTTVDGQAAPVSQPVSQPVRVAFGFRVGVGGELSRNVQSGGLQTELLIGKHLTLGVGVGMASFAGGTFTTDLEFDRKKPKPFRREYARGIDPRSDIVNIATHTVRVQIPISIGYRIPVSRTLSLLPTVSTTLSRQSREYVTFTFRQPQPLGGYETISRQIPRSVDLLNNLTFGAGVEWKRNHWAGQLGPLLTVPTVADANWQEGASFGLRARLFYQF